MPTNKEDLILTHLVELLELPDSAYEKAKNRYEDLGEWLGRDESVVTANDVHVFPQGSFRLGTAIRPLTDEEDYDLDLSCELRKGISKATHSQRNLKELIGCELERYRFARNIKESLEPKHRCWRLKYADELSFHLDIVPSIPATLAKRKIVLDSITYAQAMDHDLAVAVANLAVEITDDQLSNYAIISNDWPISNTEGYAKWFISKMTRKATGIVFDKAQVDELPIYKRKTSLQRVVQLLKRHRDQMFTKNRDSKPISIIITTLAGQACTGSDSVAQTMDEALRNLKAFADSGRSILLNPVNPAENFADRWTMPKYAHLQLKENFALWVSAAIRDFNFLASNADPNQLSQIAKDRLSVTPSTDTLSKILGINTAASFSHVSTPRNVSRPEAKPWRKEG